jgi:hypothetical protein
MTQDLVAVTEPVSPAVAEKICEVLEEHGIAATYFGREGGSGLPGGDFALALGRVSVGVDAQAAEAAVAVIQEWRKEMRDDGEPHAPPETITHETEHDAQTDALAAFGVARSRRGWRRFLRRG